jgi:hypothetical protein
MLDLKDFEVKVVAFNRGIRPAVVKNLRIESKQDAMDLDLKTDISPILEPDKSQVLTFVSRMGIHIPKDICSRSNGYLVIFPFVRESDQVKCESWTQPK